MQEIATESIVNEEADPEVPNEDAALRPSTLTGSVTPVTSIPKLGNMIITVSKRKFECVPIESASDTTEKSKKEKLDEIFQIPQVEQKAKMGPACMQGLPKLLHYVSDDRYIKILKDKEDKKKKRRKRGRRNVKKKQTGRRDGSIERGKEVCTKGVKSGETSQQG